MSFISTTIERIRSVFRRGQELPQQKSYSATMLSSHGFQRSASDVMTGHNDYLHSQTQLDDSLLSRLSDYEGMAEYPELGNCLRILADEATQEDLITKRSMWVTAKDQGVQDMLNFMFHNVLEIENHTWNMAWDLCRSGNVYEAPIVQENFGVVRLISLPQPVMRRIEDQFGHLHGYIQDAGGSFNSQSITTEWFEKKMQQREGQTYADKEVVYEPWEIVHFRYRAEVRSALYGVSVLEPARYAWRRLTLMEDSMVLYKLTRSPQRFVFYVDMGDLPPHEHKGHLETLRDNFKKKKYTNPKTGKTEFKHSPLSQDEDFFIPKFKGGRGTEIENLAGLDSQGVDDTEYFRQKLFSALPVPKTYLSMDETMSRANMSYMDARMGKTILKIQKELKNGFRQIANVHLAARNIDPDLVQFDVHMVIPSGILELVQYEVKKIQIELATQYQGLNFPEMYIWTKILNMSEDEVQSLQAMRAAEENASAKPSKASSGPSSSDDSGEEPPPEEEPEETPPEASPPGAGNAGGEQVASKLRDATNQIMESVKTGNKAIDRRIGELRSLVQEMRQHLKTSQRDVSHLGTQMDQIRSKVDHISTESKK